MVQVYRKKWERGFSKALFSYIRDLLVLNLPFRRLPLFLVKILYGIDVRFAFIVHPRSYEDIFISVPFLKPIKFFMRKQLGYRFISRMPPFVLNVVRTKQKVDGIVIAQFTGPELIFKRRKECLTTLKGSLKLASKISRPGIAVGLGGWLPMISRRGAALDGYGHSLGLTLTNGHCGTLASIYLMVEKIAKVGGLKLRDLSLAIIGVGKMGGNVAKVFNDKVCRLLLIDIRASALEKVKEQLDLVNSFTKIDTLLSDTANPMQIKSALKECHLGVCATSTFRNLLKVRDLPDGFIIIDDSRPEAVPRDPKNERIILEGGLLKIDGARVGYNYGFGEDDNVFGCLGEAFLLALCHDGEIKPTLGDVDIRNFFKMIDFFKFFGIREGDLKSGDFKISDAVICDAFKRRNLIICQPDKT